MGCVAIGTATSGIPILGPAVGLAGMLGGKAAGLTGILGPFKGLAKVVSSCKLSKAVAAACNPTIVVVINMILITEVFVDHYQNTHGLYM